MDKYFYTYKGKDIESDEAYDVAAQIYELTDVDEELRDKVIKAIIDKMVNKYDDDSEQYISPSQEKSTYYYNLAVDWQRDYELGLFNWLTSNITNNEEE